MGGFPRGTPIQFGVGGFPGGYSHTLWEWGIPRGTPIHSGGGGFPGGTPIHFGVGGIPGGYSHTVWEWGIPGSTPIHFGVGGFPGRLSHKLLMNPKKVADESLEKLPKSCYFFQKVAEKFAHCFLSKLYLSKSNDSIRGSFHFT